MFISERHSAESHSIREFEKNIGSSSFGKWGRSYGKNIDGNARVFSAGYKCLCIFWLLWRGTGDNERENDMGGAGYDNSKKD